jgi:hypothetical protein
MTTRDEMIRQNVCIVSSRVSGRQEIRLHLARRRVIYNRPSCASSTKLVKRDSLQNPKLLHSYYSSEKEVGEE